MAYNKANDSALWSAEQTDAWDQKYKRGKYAAAVPAPAAPVAPAAPGSTYVAPNLAPPNAGSVTQQAANAQTYSATPAAAPAAATTNQGTQDVTRNSYIQQATQPKTIDANDPNVRQQTDVFAAGQDRSRRQYESEQAERLSAQGLGNSGAMANERRLGAERAGQATGAFETELIGRELENRRQEIQTALTSLSGMISDDQKRAMMDELARIADQTQRLGITTGAAGDAAKTAVTSDLGNKSINVDMIRALLQNQQFGTSAGIDIGSIEANNYFRGLGL